MNPEIRFRAEWEPQSAVLLVWPHDKSDWAGMLDRVTPVYREMATAIAEHQQVILIARDECLKMQLESAFTGNPNILVVAQPTNDTWIRDYGPLSVGDDGAIQQLDFRFNAWGGKYASEFDDAVTGSLGKLGIFDCDMKRVELVLEGGAVETDGLGTLLATRGSIVCQRRNPGLNQSNIEERLSRLLGIERFLWLECDGLQGDDTDGHIDTLVRFADSRTLLYASCSPEHPDHPALKTLEQQVRSLRRGDGEPYRTIPLPCPGIHRAGDGRMLPASYANFLLTDRLVLQPIYDTENDEAALDIMRRAFPGREVVPIDSRVLIEQNGSIHCATMQTACPLRNH